MIAALQEEHRKKESHRDHMVIASLHQASQNFVCLGVARLGFQRDEGKMHG